MNFKEIHDYAEKIAYERWKSKFPNQGNQYNWIQAETMNVLLSMLVCEKDWISTDSMLSDAEKGKKQ